MRDRQMKLRGVGRTWQELPIRALGFLMVADANAGVGVDRAVGAIVGLYSAKFCYFLERLRVLVPLRQHDRVLVTRGVIGRLELQNALQQKLGVVEDVELHGDLREQ